jgi:DNA-binding response OmpR family regulator
MGQILLMNFDEEMGSKLAVALRNQRHSVVMLPKDVSFAKALTLGKGSPDLVILDFSRIERNGRTLLSEIVFYRARYGPWPMLLCVSRVYRGPQFELDLERKGARVVYV